MSVEAHSPKQATGHALGGLISSMARLAAKVLAKSGAAVKALQMGRMLSTLSNMSDEQLAQIGISRSDIPKYAEELMAAE